MKFGVLLFLSWPERRVSAETVYARALERVEIMDQSGYDAVWLAEHHFTTYSICPSVHLLGTYIAARTKRLRIGTGVSLVPFYNPLRLAEEIAMLDILSGGRVNWGAGRGYQLAEFNIFGVPPKDSYEVFREHLDVVIQAWTQDSLTYQGKYVSYTDVEVLPKPLQKPHPPVWLATSSAESITWAGSRGYSILLDPIASHQQLRGKRDLYQEQLEAHGFSMAKRDIPMARFICVEDTLERARAVAQQGLEWYVRFHKLPGMQHVGHETQLNRQRNELYNVEFDRPVSEEVAHFLEQSTIYGTPEMCIDQIARLREEAGMDYLMCAPLSQRTFTMFTERVMPHFV